jgi:enoyl-CoA hydratase/carnithine racemase
MNALNTAMAVELSATLEALQNEPDIRCLVLTGAGERAFCPGADLKERNGMSTEAWLRQHKLFQKAAQALMRFPAPLIAAVEGYALAGGLELAVCSDFIIAGEGSAFGLPEVKRGLLPGLGGPLTVPRIIGRNRAKELIFTGRMLATQEALDWGLVNRVVPRGEAVRTALEIAQTISANAPIAVRQAKTAIDYGADMDITSGWKFSLEAYNILIPTEDRLEGIRAFNEKRPPRFQNR